MRALVALALGLAGIGAARAETLVSSLSTQRVEITSNYTGSSIVAFGSIERDGQSIARATGYDIVITVRGPRHPLVVREKAPLGPIWINQTQRTFPNMPAFLGVFASRPIAEVTTEPLRQRFGVGVEAIVNAPERAAIPQRFRDALVRLRRQERLFIENGNGVAFLTPTLFRAPIPLPATAPTGLYQVETALFADGVVLARTQTAFLLVKTGLEQSLAEFARYRPLAYGLATAAAALLFGWLASVIFRRD